MNTPALIMLLSSQILITAFVVYFFWKVLNTPKKPEPDSFTENDSE